MGIKQHAGETNWNKHCIYGALTEWLVYNHNTKVRLNANWQQAKLQFLQYLYSTWLCCFWCLVVSHLLGTLPIWMLNNSFFLFFFFSTIFVIHPFYTFQLCFRELTSISVARSLPYLINAKSWHTTTKKANHCNTYCTVCYTRSSSIITLCVMCYTHAVKR